MAPIPLLQYAAALASFIILAWSVVLAAWLAAHYRELRHRRLVNIVILLAGLLAASHLSLLSAVFFVISPAVLVASAALGGLAVIVLGLLLAYAYRNKGAVKKALALRPVSEARHVRRGRAAKAVARGSIYLAKESKPREAYRVFTSMLSAGMKGLCITMDSPARVRSKYGLKETPIIEVTADFMRTTRPEEVGYKLGRFIIDARGNAVLVMDCIERIITNTNFSEAFHLVQRMRDVVMKNNAVMIISVNPKVFNEKELALIEQETEPLSGV